MCAIWPSLWTFLILFALIYFLMQTLPLDRCGRLASWNSKMSSGRSRSSRGFKCLKPSPQIWEGGQYGIFAYGSSTPLSGYCVMCTVCGFHRLGYFPFISQNSKNVRWLHLLVSLSQLPVYWPLLESENLKSWRKQYITFHFQLKNKDKHRTSFKKKMVIFHYEL